METWNLLWINAFDNVEKYLKKTSILLLHLTLTTFLYTRKYNFFSFSTWRGRCRVRGWAGFLIASFRYSRLSGAILSAILWYRVSTVPLSVSRTTSTAFGAIRPGCILAPLSIYLSLKSIWTFSIMSIGSILSVLPGQHSLWEV